MPTSRRPNVKSPKRYRSSDSEDNDKKPKVTGRGRGRDATRGASRGASRDACSGREGVTAITDGDNPSEEGTFSGGKRKRGRRRRGRGRGPKADGQPPAKRRNKKQHSDELQKCLRLMEEFEKKIHNNYTSPFRLPVDAALLGLDDYHQIIKWPMDMSTMKRKLVGEEYETAVEFKKDFQRMINNCLTYYDDNEPEGEMAIEFREEFVAKWRKEFPEDLDDFAYKGSEDNASDVEDEVFLDDGEEDHDMGVKAVSPGWEKVKSAEKAGETQAAKSEYHDDNEDERHEKEDSIDKKNRLDDDRDRASSYITTAANTTTPSGVAASLPKAVELIMTFPSEPQAACSSETQATSADVTFSEEQPQTVSAQPTISHATDSTIEADSTDA